MGQVLAGGSSRAITADELQSVGTMQQAMTQIPVPTLQHRDNPHEYLFFAMFDGSGQDLDNPKLGPPTNVGHIALQARAIKNDPNNRIGAHYTRGIGSQSFAPARVLDGAFAGTWDDGIKEMYREFSSQARKWLDTDPQAQIRVAGLGYSRGAVQEVGFLRLVDQYGIANPENLKFGRDQHGNLTVQSAYPALVPPGQVAQVAVLLDPVVTNMPRDYDARLSPRAISSVSILAGSEQRRFFPHQAINDLGMTPDGRALNVSMPGGHSNIGGGNQQPGLEILAGNAVTDYLNLLSDRPLFEKRPVPADLSTVTVYQARGATAAFGLAMDRDGARDVREALANCRIVDPCKDSEPVDQVLAAQFEYRNIRLDPTEQARLEALIEQARRAEASRQPAQAPASTSAQQSPESDTLRPSDQGRAVVNLQSGLIQLGYHHRVSQPLQVSGVYDDATRQAVTAFQAQRDVEISGIADLATQHALQQALLAQQTQQQRQTEREQAREQERKAGQDAVANEADGDPVQGRGQAGALLPFSDPDHPHHALYADVQQRFQAKGHALSEKQLSVLTGQMHLAGHAPGWEGEVTVYHGKAFAQGSLPGARAHVDLTTPTPPVPETMQAFQADERTREQNQEAFRQQQAMAQEHGHGLTR